MAITMEQAIKAGWTLEQWQEQIKKGVSKPVSGKVKTKKAPKSHAQKTESKIIQQRNNYIKGLLQHDKRFKTHDERFKYVKKLYPELTRKIYNNLVG